MKILFTTLVLIMFSAFSSAQTTIVNYDFNSGSDYFTFSHDSLAGVTSTLTGSNTSTTFAGVASGGLAFASNTAGNAMGLNNSSGAYSKYFQFCLTGSTLSAFSNYKVYFQVQRSTAGAQKVQIEYSSDSLTYTPFDTVTVPTSFAEFVIDFSSATSLNSSDTIILRLSLGDASSTGTFRIDNFQLQGTCAGGTEPTLEASNNTDTVTCSDATISWVKGDGTKRLVVIKKDSPVTAIPIDFTSYNANSIYGLGSQIASGEYVVYSDTGTTVNVTSLGGFGNFYYKIFEYNIGVCAGSENYLTGGITAEGMFNNSISEPDNASSNVNVFSLCTYANLDWSVGNGAGRIVVIKKGSPVTSVPTDFTSYTADTTFGSGTQITAGEYVVYSGTASSVSISNLGHKATYYYAIFEYQTDGCSGGKNYLTTTSATGSFTTESCFEIQSILVNACTPSIAASESKNEMFTFKTFNQPIDITKLQVGGGSGTTVTWNKWPNPFLPFNDFVQDALTASKTSQIDGTIATTCGKLIEPPLGIIPPNSQVIVFTDRGVHPTANSFENLTDTLYAVFQEFTTDSTAGCFANTNNQNLPTSTPQGTSSIRNLAMRYLLDANISDTVSYERNLLVNTNYSTGSNLIYGLDTANNILNKGATVRFDNFGNTSYINLGCQAPYLNFTINPTVTSVKNATTLCGKDSLLLQANPSMFPVGNIQWTYTVLGGGSLPGTLTPSGPTTNDTVYFSTNGVDTATVIFSVSLEDKCGITHSKSILVHISKPPIISLSADKTNGLCEGDIVTLTASLYDGSTYTWNDVASGTIDTLSATTSGHYVIKSTNVCGWDTAGIWLNFRPKPDNSIFDNGPLNICGAPSLILSGVDSTRYTYQWLNNDLPYGTGNVSYSLPITESGNYSIALAYNDLPNCMDTTAVKVVTINPIPNATLANDFEACAGETQTIGVAAETNMTYTWTSNPAGTYTNTSTIDVAPTVQTSYNLEVNGLGGCTATDDITISMTAVATASINISANNTNLEYCPGDTILLSSAISNGGANPSYAWSLNGNTLSGRTSDTLMVTSFNNGDVFVSTLISSSTCVTSDSVTSNTITIIKNTAPDVSLSASQNYICGTGTVDLTATVANADSYIWSDGTPNAATITVGTSGIYSVTATSVCGNSTDSVTIIGYPNPAASINESSATICETALPYSLSAGTTDTNYTYQWNLDGFGIADATDSILNTAAAGSYTLTVSSGPNNECGSQTNVTPVVLTIDKIISFSIAATKGALCGSGDNITLTVTPTNTSVYTWSTGEITQASINVTTTGIYSVAATNVCGTQSTDTTIAQYALPNAVINESSMTICETSLPQNLTAVTHSDYNYQWSLDGTAISGETNSTLSATAGGSYTLTVGSGPSNVCGTDTSIALIITTEKMPVISISADKNALCGTSDQVQLTGGATNTTTYSWNTSETTSTVTITTPNTYTFTAYNTCGSVDSTKTITQFASPIAAIQQGTSLAVCETALPVALNATTTHTDYTYLWTKDSVDLSTITNPNVTVSTAGSYTIKVTSGPNAECGTAESAALVLTVNKMPTAFEVTSNSTSTTFCSGVNIELSGPTVPAGQTYQWQLGGTDISGATTKTLAVSAAGDYKLIITGPGCGSLNDTYQIMEDSVRANFTPSTYSDTAAVEISFTNWSSTATYSWDFNGLGNSTETNPKYNFEKSGKYTVILTATSSLGCTDTAMVVLDIKEPPINTKFPNIFTPNGDANNDIFKAVDAASFIELTIKIYTRWGQLVYEAGTPGFTWDGKTDGGKEVSDGTYYYLVVGKTRATTGDNAFSTEGYVTVVR